MSACLTVEYVKCLWVCHPVRLLAHMQAKAASGPASLEPDLANQLATALAEKAQILEQGHERECQLRPEYWTSHRTIEDLEGQVSLVLPACLWSFLLNPTCSSNNLSGTRDCCHHSCLWLDPHILLPCLRQSVLQSQQTGPIGKVTGLGPNDMLPAVCCCIAANELTGLGPNGNVASSLLLSCCKCTDCLHPVQIAREYFMRRELVMPEGDHSARLLQDSAAVLGSSPAL